MLDSVIYPYYSIGRNRTLFSIILQMLFPVLVIGMPDLRYPEQGAVKSMFNRYFNYVCEN
jgi:hypothetical protein